VRAGGTGDAERYGKRLLPDAMLARTVGGLRPSRKGTDGACECSTCAGNTNGGSYAGSAASASAGSGVSVSMRSRCSKSVELGHVWRGHDERDRADTDSAVAGQRTHSAAGRPGIIPGSGAARGRAGVHGSRIVLARKWPSMSCGKRSQSSPASCRLCARARHGEERERERGREREARVGADRGERASELPLAMARPRERVRARRGAQRVLA
jgi:hypothetical protein